MTSSFRSYVDLTECDGPRSEYDGYVETTARLMPRLLPGEVIIAEAQKVLKFTAHSDQKQGVIGSLFVTNFKLSFVTTTTSYKLVDQGQLNSLLGPNDICLINIDSLYQDSKTNYKMKKLEPGSSITGRIKILQVHCRDFRVCTFGFKFCALGEDKTVINAILHHAYPVKPELLFAFEYKEKHPNGNSDMIWKTCMFHDQKDYEDELKRLKCQSWRVSNINKNFTCKTFPCNVVVPSTFSDIALTSVASNFPHYRFPVWSWGNENGCVIVRACGKLPNNDNTYGHQIYEFIKAMKKSHPYNWDPVLLNLDDLLPNAKDIYNHFSKFKELCTPESYLQYQEQDSRFWSTLNASNWLQTIATFLNVANQAATKIHSYKVSVVLKELKGRDLSCVISSLAQIILDPHYRTISGFQSLIQKEWIAMGHPFLNRLGRLRRVDKESPVFLLFLDCVWQMIQQCPTSFEFNEIYLTTIWDSSHISIFDTFLFNCEYDRKKSRTSRHLELQSVWEWQVQFTRLQTSDFINPLFSFAKDVKNVLSSEELSSRKLYQQSNSIGHEKNNSRVKTEVEMYDNVHQHQKLHRTATMWSLRMVINNLSDVRERMEQLFEKWQGNTFISIQAELPLMKLWRLCYFRWMPYAQIVGGGPPTEYMAQCRLIREIKFLQRQLASFVEDSKSPDSPVSGTSEVENLTQCNMNKDDDTMLVTSSYPFSAGGAPRVPGMSFTYFRQSSFIPSDDELDNDYF